MTADGSSIPYLVSALILAVGALSIYVADRYWRQDKVRAKPKLSIVWRWAGVEVWACSGHGCHVVAHSPEEAYVLWCRSRALMERLA